MNYSMNELMKLILEICPNAVFHEDSEGQIVVSTNLSQQDSDPEQPLVDMGE
jgi:hypothetical protein